MKETKYKLGDVVKFRAGKRKMVIVKILGGEDSILGGYLYTCEWETPEAFKVGDFEGFEIEGVRK